MPLSQYERSVVLFNMHVEMVPAEAEASRVVSMEAAIRMIADAFQAKRAHMQVGEHLDDEEDEALPTTRGGRERSSANRLAIKQIDWTADNVVTMLIQHGDTAAADPALINLETGVVRTAGKKDTEAVAHAAHLLIDLSSNSRRTGGRVRAVIERVPNIGRSAVTVFLNRILRQEAQLSRMEYEDENFHRKRCHPKFVGHTQMSHGLREDLEGGKLSRVEFITQHVEDGYEEPDIIHAQSHVLTHKVIKSPPGSSVMEFIERLRAWGKDRKYEQMQLHFTRAKDQRQISPSVSTDLDDAEDVVYSRLELIEDFTELLEQCPESIVEEIQAKMRVLLSTEAYWK